MARLIDADKRIEEIKKIYCDGCDNYGGVKCRACWVDDAMCLIDDATTVDAAEVIRCLECKHWLKDVAGCTDFVGRCELANYMVGAVGYCVYGERKDGDGNG